MFSARVAFGFLLVSGAAVAQQYVISTIAGGAPPPTPVAGTSVSIGYPSGVAVDALGNVYFEASECVFKLDSNGALARIAGNGRAGYSGDGGSGVAAQLYLPLFATAQPTGLALDGHGNVFVADTFNQRIREISTSGIITTVAGNGTFGGFSEGIPAVNATLYPPSGVAVDGQGNIFIADFSYSAVWKVSPAGTITRVAGTAGSPGYSGDGGPATSAQLSGPQGIAVDTQGNLFIAELYNNRIRKVARDGTISTAAGNGTAGYSGDGGPATSAQIKNPQAVAVDGQGNLFIADWVNDRIRKVSSGGIITTVAGNGTEAYSGDGGPATSAGLQRPVGVAVDGQGNLFIADWANFRIRKVSSAGIITTVAGNGTCCYAGDGGRATDAQLYWPQGTAVDGQGNVFIADAENQRILRVSPGGIITVVAGNGTFGYSGDGGPAKGAQLSYPSGVAVDGQGNIFIADFQNSVIRKVSLNGNISTVAGNGTRGYSGDGGPAISAKLNSPTGIVVDGQQNLFVVDSRNSVIRKISSGGIITTVAGNGSSGYSGDGGTAITAQLNLPTTMAVDGQGALFIADQNNNRIRKVSPNGIITTFAGNGTNGYSGDGGQATNAKLGLPYGVAVDAQGNLFLTDSRVRVVSPNGIITTVAGSGSGGYSGDGGPATNAQFSGLASLAVDGQGSVYVADQSNSAIRRLQPTNQSVLLSAVVDAASENVGAISPGKIVVLYGGGLGPANLSQNQPTNGVYSTQLAGTTVSFNGIAAPMVYTWATAAAAIVPYQITGTTAQVTVSYQGQMSSSVTVPVAASAPGIFTLNQTGAGQAAAINAIDGSINTAANPVKVGGYISLYATGEGQTTPAGIDGKVASGPALPQPNLKVSATVGGIPAFLQYAGAAPGQVAGLMQVNVLIPAGVQPGGYVPVVLQVGDASTTPGAVWIAVAGN